MGTYVAPAKQMQNWCQPPKPVEFDANHEPTAADHGDVLYVIKKDPMIGRYMVAARDIKPGEAIFTDQPAVVGKIKTRLGENFPFGRLFYSPSKLLGGGASK
jgi:hypothetical protein